MRLCCMRLERQRVWASLNDPPAASASCAAPRGRGTTASRVCGAGWRPPSAAASRATSPGWQHGSAQHVTLLGRHIRALSRMLQQAWRLALTASSMRSEASSGLELGCGRLAGGFKPTALSQVAYGWKMVLCSSRTAHGRLGTGRREAVSRSAAVMPSHVMNTVEGCHLFEGGACEEARSERQVVRHMQGTSTEERGAHELPAPAHCSPIGRTFAARIARLMPGMSACESHDRGTSLSAVHREGWQTVK
jgi:hypothetical protein